MKALPTPTTTEPLKGLDSKGAIEILWVYAPFAFVTLVG